MRPGEQAYERFASVYDWLFGPILQAGRREAVKRLSIRSGAAILEVGIGTGLTATLYPPDCAITGIDASERMLRQAAKRLTSRGVRNVRLLQMDASELHFADETFDIVYAAYVVSAVTDPLKVVREMRRVCRADGHIVLLNHFRSEGPVLSRLERFLSPLTARVGFVTDLDLRALVSHAQLDVHSVQRVNLPRIWSLVTCGRASTHPRSR